MSGTEFSWMVISGHGSHLKATSKELVISRDGEVQKSALDRFNHLLVVGMHMIHTSVLLQLSRAGIFISFFDTDAKPIGFVRPYGFRWDEEMRQVQERLPVHRFALAIAKAAMKSRLLFLEGEMYEKQRFAFFRGEQELLHRAHDEVQNLVKIDEIRRLLRLSSDMYYEALARSAPSALGFGRRTERPHNDPVNAMFSLGYAMLYGACNLEVFGVHLDPDRGFLTQGEGALVSDLIEPFKTPMVDRVVMEMVWEGIPETEFERGDVRCHLSDSLAGALIERLRRTIDTERLHLYVQALRTSMLRNTEFVIPY